MGKKVIGFKDLRMNRINLSYPQFNPVHIENPLNPDLGLIPFIKSIATQKVFGLFPQLLCKVRRYQIVALVLGIVNGDAPYN